MGRACLFLSILSLFNTLPSFGGVIFCNGTPGNLVLNCGFTSGNFSDPAHLGNFTGGVPSLNPYSENFYTELGTVTGGALRPSSSPVSTSGRTYFFSFAANDSPGSASSPSDFWADWEGTNLSSSDQFTPSFTRFSAAVATTGLTAANASFRGLDDVSIETVDGEDAPEPASTLLVAMGLFGILVRRRVSRAA